MQNRLNEIRESSNIEKWNYVKGNSNPADMLPQDELNKLKTTAVNIATSNVHSISHIIKDTHKENSSSNKIPALTKSMNIDI